MRTSIASTGSSSWSRPFCSLVAVLAASTGFQAATWSGAQFEADNQAGASRVEANLLDTVAGEQFILDGVEYLTAGTFDSDAELDIFISGGDHVSKQFGKKSNILEVESVLAHYVLG